MSYSRVASVPGPPQTLDVTRPAAGPGADRADCISGSFRTADQPPCLESIGVLAGDMGTDLRKGLPHAKCGGAAQDFDDRPRRIMRVLTVVLVDLVDDSDQRVLARLVRRAIEDRRARFHAIWLTAVCLPHTLDGLPVVRRVADPHV
jgi:hypothetical protein